MLGLGSTHADIDAALGPGDAPDANGVVVYGDVGLTEPPALGVLYTQDADCVERAAAFLMNYSNEL